MELKFKAKIWKTGTSRVVTIPDDYIKHGLLEEDGEYTFIITQEKEAKK